MKEMVDIHVVLATPEDMQEWEEHAEEVTERFNDMLHYLYNRADEDIETEKLEKIIQYVWEYWSKDQQLIDIDVEDLYDWVDQLLATWDDGDFNSLDDDN